MLANKSRNGRRQGDIIMGCWMHAQRAQDQPDILEKKITVLEKSEHAQVDRQAGDEQPFAVDWVLRLTQLAPNIVVRH